MDYDSVNNPFITLRKLGGEEEFTTKLNSAPPNVDNDPNMSNLKKSNHELYSDKRTSKMRMDEKTKDFKNYSITLMDIDNILYEYFVNVINPLVLDSNGTVVKVPVRHASPERWGAIQADGRYRDEKGQIQRPMIIFTRSSVARDDAFVHFNKYLTVPFVKKFGPKNMYDRFSLLNDASPLYEVHNVTFPDHVVLTYDFTMSTEYVQQMNTLVEKINFAEGDYWGDPKRLKFRASVDSFSNTVEVPTDDDRNVSTTFSVQVNAYLLPEVFDDKTTVQRGLSTRKVIWGTEVSGTPQDIFGGESTSLSHSALLVELGAKTKSYIFNRKTDTIYLDDSFDEYNIRMWNDLEYYTLNIGGISYKIAPDVDENSNDILIWDFEKEEVALLPGDSHTIRVTEKVSVELRVHDRTTEMITVRYTKN